MTVLVPFVGREKSTDNVTHASGVFASRRSVVRLSDGKDRKVEKQLAACMKEIQQLMKVSSLRHKEKI